MTIRSPAFALALAFALGGCGGRQLPWPVDAAAKEAPPTSAEVSTLNPGYDRVNGRVLVRQIARPTRANLDLAAYLSNVMIHDPAPESVPAPAKTVPDVSQAFGGCLVPGSVRATLGQTPLSEAERQAPLAFSPLVDFLVEQDYAHAEILEDARSAIRSERWGRSGPAARPYQDAVLAFLHQGEGGAIELWVEIEFQPWAALFGGMPDADGDAFPEVFGRIEASRFPAELSTLVQQEYRGRELGAGEVRGWADNLASYWYPSYNTDIAELEKGEPWPDGGVEPEVREALGALKIAQPTILMRGKPQGQSVYNLFVVPGMGWLAPGQQGSGAASGLTSAVPRKTSAILGGLEQQIQQELLAGGQGRWENWFKGVQALHADFKAQLGEVHEDAKAMPGKDGFLFYTRSVEALLGGDLRQQPAGKDPFPVIVGFKRFLELQGVDFLFVPVPSKLEVFPDKLASRPIPRAALGAVNPYGRKFLYEVGQAGVELIDLMPVFLAARRAHEAGEEELYQRQDTHWTSRGMQIAAKVIAERIRKYPWYAELEQRAMDLGEKQTSFTRYGDLHSRLAEEQKKGYKPPTLPARQVLMPDGALYDDDPDSPVVLLGDSFTGVFQRTDCKHAGVSAQIAHAIRYPVDLVMSYGGGPGVRKKLLRRGADSLKTKRLVIWMFAARDLFDYWEDWEALPEEQGAK